MLKLSTAQLCPKNFSNVENFLFFFLCLNFSSSIRGQSFSFQALETFILDSRIHSCGSQPTHCPFTLQLSLSLPLQPAQISSLKIS